MAINIYLIARISKDAHFWNNKISGALNPLKIKIFKPHQYNPWNIQHKKLPKKVFDVDLKEIKKAHIGLLLPEFGSDCAWECGWFSNSNKPLVAFINTQTDWLRNWMVKGGIDYVITNNPQTYKVLKKDPILKHKQIILIKQLRSLNKKIEKIYQKHYHNIC